MECLVLLSTFSILFKYDSSFAEFSLGKSYFRNSSEPFASVQGQSLFLTAKNGVSLRVMESAIGTWC